MNKERILRCIKLLEMKMKYIKSDQEYSGSLYIKLCRLYSLLKLSS